MTPAAGDETRPEQCSSPEPGAPSPRPAENPAAVHPTARPTADSASGSPPVPDLHPRVGTLPPLPIGPLTATDGRGKARLGADGRPRHRRPVALLMLGATGVVFGDIGTSPLYALQTVFSTHHNAVAPTDQDVLGVISMITWCLVVIVTIAYVGIILRADNQGEGGILSLAALILRKLGPTHTAARTAFVLAIIGAALFFGDSLITPAISVLSAVEGVQVVQHSLARWVVPLALIVLALLFLAQRWGTGRIGRAFGPVMVLWFVVLAALGLPHIIANPAILRALSPTYALDFAVDRPVVAFIAMGAVVLAVTGVEALYADMGHFGRRPIALAWICLILPALLVNYFGQGALILTDPSAADNPFFRLAPEAGRVPLVVLATAATVIASQAVISGAFSVARQASRLSLLPRLSVRQTSAEHGGQIYVPAVNAMLFLGVLVLVLAFGSSTRLASAYGLAVTATLLLELSLFLLLAARVRRWTLWRVALMGAVVGGLELVLFSANVAKIAAGGWLPLLIAGTLVTVMLTWRRGAHLLFSRRREMEGPIQDFVTMLRAAQVPRVRGLAVYPHGDPATVPLALRSNVRFNQVLHRHVVLVTVTSVGVPHVRHDVRTTVTDLGDPTEGIFHVTYRVGFHDSQDIPAAVRKAMDLRPDLAEDPDEAMYMLSVFRIEKGGDLPMPRWQKSLFRVLEKAGANRTEALHLPPDRTIVIGAETLL